MSNIILADGRMQGKHGIGRFATEVLQRLDKITILTNGPSPLSMRNVIWQPFYLRYLLSRERSYKVFFNPAFMPPLLSPLPYVFTIHDLIHLEPKLASFSKRLIYHSFIRQAAKSAYKILTVSDYSKHKILEWLAFPAEQVVVVGNGVSDLFCEQGDRYHPGFPYLLHVGNAKSHKNIERLLKAFAVANISAEIKLISTARWTKEQTVLIHALKIEKRVISSALLSDERLASYYRGALGVVLPSLYEGFGLPIIEAMASGIPVLTSTLTAMPEVAGNAAILVNPYKIDEITAGIESLIHDQSNNADLVAIGKRRVNTFSWEQVAKRVQATLSEVTG